jgi:putative ABC transport system ATP-binding protein
MSASPVVIDARGLVKRVRVGSETKAAVSGIDLNVLTGEMVLVAGRSGSGKTTLLTILGGLLRADEGLITVLGHEFAAMSDHARRAFVRRDVGLVFQASGLLPGLSAAENVSFALHMLGIQGPQVERRAVKALEWVGLGARARHRTEELSGGEQQRVALARALVKEPQLLLADEPTSQLDVESGKAVVDLLKEASLSGTTVVVATHDQTLEQVADRVVRLEDGRVVSAR